MEMKRISILALLMLSLTVFTACNQEEQDDLAKAQECLDHVPQDHPENANDCLHYAEKYTSQQANILKCSIIMTSGGLIESKVVKAYNVLKDQSDNNREAAFMSVLALNIPTVADGLTKAKKADVFCQASGVPGLRYISGLIVAGTFMGSVLPGSPDLDDPTAVKSAVTTFLNDCTQPGGPTGSCATDLTTLGQATTTLATSYCNSADPTDEVCANISTALTSAGGDPAKVGLALTCYLNNKTYNPSTGECNP
jgi:hypothetical protein